MAFWNNDDIVDFSGDLADDRTKILDYNNQLGQPHLIRPLPNIPEIIYGYWRIAGGVSRYCRQANGLWDPNSRIDYTDEEIKTMFNLLDLSPIS